MTRRLNDPQVPRAAPSTWPFSDLFACPVPPQVSGVMTSLFREAVCVWGGGGPALVPSPSHTPTSTAQRFPAVSSPARKGRWSESSALAGCGMTWSQWLCVELQKRLRAWHSGLAAWKRGRQPRPALAAASPTLGLHQPSALLTSQSHCVLSTSPGPLTIENIPASSGSMGVWGRDP